MLRLRVISRFLPPLRNCTDRRLKLSAMKNQQRTTKNKHMDNSKREQETGKQQSVTRTVVEISVYLVLFFIVVFITPKYLAHTTIVDGDSMMPCLYDKEKVILEMLSKQTD